MTARRLAPFLGLVLLAACGQPGPNATSGSAVPSASAVASDPAGGAPIELAGGGPLAPGTYTRSAFVPPVSFDLDGPWQAVQLLDGFFDVQQHPGSPDVMTVQFARPDAISGGDGIVPVTDAATAVQLLTANDELTVVESSTSRIGGLDGVQITLENPASAAADRQVMHVPPGTLSISPGRRLWIAFFDTSDGLLAVMVGGSVAKWDEALAAAEPVLESVRIGK